MTRNMPVRRLKQDPDIDAPDNQVIVVPRQPYAAHRTYKVTLKLPGRTRDHDLPYFLTAAATPMGREARSGVRLGIAGWRPPPAWRSGRTPG